MGGGGGGGGAGGIRCIMGDVQVAYLEDYFNFPNRSAKKA